MTLKGKFAIGLLPTVLSGLGTYELLRRNGHSLNHDAGHKTNEVPVENGGSQDKEQTSKEAEIDASSGQKPDEPATSEPKLQSYKEYLESKNITLVDGKTQPEVLKNILLHRMFPHYRKNFTFAKDQMFMGSPEINFKGKSVQGKNKSLFILDKHDDQGANSLRDACIAALEKGKPEDKENKSDLQTYRLKAWCSVPTIKDVLIRHKFKLLKSDDWEKILDSD